MDVFAAIANATVRTTAAVNKGVRRIMRPAKRTSSSSPVIFFHS
jgi:hypothetical protein